MDRALAAAQADRALAAAQADRALAAVFLWKGFPGETRHAGYQLQSPALRAVIQARGQPTAPPR